MSPDYQEYMQSATWQALKDGHPDPRQCVACRAKKRIELHHMRYPKDIWRTRAADCCWLCDSCHELLHRAFLGERKKYKSWATTKGRIAMLIQAQRDEEGMGVAAALARIVVVDEIQGCSEDGEDRDFIAWRCSGCKHSMASFVPRGESAARACPCCNASMTEFMREAA